MTRAFDVLALAVLLGALPPWLVACGRTAPPPAGTKSPARDAHSFARPWEVAVRHLALDLTVDFAARRLSGRASLTLEGPGAADRLYLDTRDLEIQRVLADDGETELPFALGDEVPYLGRPLAVDLGPDTRVVHVDYATRPAAAALQWLAPEQTAGGTHPFLFTQSQAILARTWIPCQDTPAVRMTYAATLRVPPGLLALMSAENPTAVSADGVYTFRMPQAIPSYLMALAVGDLEHRALGLRSGVYAEPGVVEAAAWEFADTEAMIAAAEALYGPYRWGRYDLLVLPPSFPFGGMENPRLTFATPTILAGDRSLVALVAHELAHSWSGNLVTNATWNDFWLNEGFTTYFERRIMEALYGREYAEMLALLSLEELERTMEELDSPDTHLHLDLAGRDPDDGMNDVAYDKGYFFLRRLEETVGRERWDAFLRGYFEAHAFRSMDTAGFLGYLHDHLLAADPAWAEAVAIDAWVYGPGLPADRPPLASAALAKVEAEVARWQDGTPAAALATEGWTTHEWLHFLRRLPAPLAAERMAALDAAFGFSASGNSEILQAWLLQAISSRYQPADPALERFLTSVGRRKFLRPLYQKLAETPDGLERARAIYQKARPGYHSVAANTVDEILGWEG